MAAAPSQFSLPGFNTQPQNLGLSIQAVNLSGQSQLNKSAAPFKPAAQQQAQQAAGSQVGSYFTCDDQFMDNCALYIAGVIQIKK